jgi:hypothetical protein
MACVTMTLLEDEATGQYLPILRYPNGREVEGAWDFGPPERLVKDYTYRCRQNGDEMEFAGVKPNYVR